MWGIEHCVVWCVGDRALCGVVYVRESIVGVVYVIVVAHLPRGITQYTERIYVEGPLVGVLLVACTLESLSEAMRKEA